MANNNDQLNNAFMQLADDTKSFSYPQNTVEKIDAKDITPTEFYKSYISKNRPCIIKNLCNHWPALKKWNDDDYIIDACGDKEISVNVTPNGYADALYNMKGVSRKGNATRKVFVKPLEEKMTMKSFLTRLKAKDNKPDDPVLYCSRQNNSLIDEFSALLKDVEHNLLFANNSLDNNNKNVQNEATNAEAINLWIGDEQSISTTHQDPYENFYAVVRGTKIFTLYPPSDVGFLYEKVYPTASYVKDANKNLCIQIDNETTCPWITMDLTQTDDEINENFPKFKLAHQVVATVEKGECLYLPSLWFHHVQQRGLTIAVNYWYDMIFDFKFSFYNFVRTNSGLLSYGENFASELKSTIIFDFDWTMVNENTDTWVFKVLAPDLYDEIMTMRKSNKNDKSNKKLTWQELMNYGLKQLKVKYNCGREELQNALGTMPIFVEIFNMIRIMHEQGHEIIILSDANEFYIDYILKKYNIHDAITQIITNKSAWTSSSNDLLQIMAYHSDGEHACNLCPKNLCKGKVVQQLRQENFRMYRKCFYVGDGGGDFCPFTTLNPTDYMYVREDYSCHREIVRWNTKNESWPQPNVKTWQNGKDVYDYFQNDLEIITSIDQFSEAMLPIETAINEEIQGENVQIELWYRTWGNKANGIPVLFVHGGPGNCVADYQNINSKFFDKNKFYVIEVDQRGTGKSKPSVRDDYNNMKYYLDISIKQMSNDFELIRKHLKIDRWLVFGGSWGSTLGLDYAERYPSKCLGLIVRGIYLNTKDEFDAIYCRKSFENNERRLKEFDIFFELAKGKVKDLDPNDSEQFIQIYEKMIINGNKDAAWRFYVFENNLMEENPEELLDPFNISEKLFPEALSVSFFESRLFLKGTFENPEQLNLLTRVKELKNGYNGIPVDTWVVQGVGDEVCPEIFAQQLVKELEKREIPFVDHFVDAGHKASSDGIGIALIECVEDFLRKYTKIETTEQTHIL